jgi:prevent-host-death family protein
MPKTLNVSEFRKQALDLLDHLPAEGILITKRGKPLAKVIPAKRSYGDWIGSMKGQFEVRGDIFSTGIRWEADDGLIDGRTARRQAAEAPARRARAIPAKRPSGG